MTERVGIYGGTFDPPHLGHIHLIRCMLAQIPVDRLLVVPNHSTPKKGGAVGASATDRLRMAELAFSDLDPRVEISDAEILRGDVSYTVDTVRAWTMPNRRLYFLCGADLFVHMDRWRDAERLLRSVEPCVAVREGDEEELCRIRTVADRYLSAFSCRTHILTASPCNVSSTAVRAMLQSRDADCVRYLPPTVYRYICERGLYQC